MTTERHDQSLRREILLLTIVLSLLSCNGFAFPTSNLFLGTHGMSTGEVQYLRSFFAACCFPMMFAAAALTNRIGYRLTIALGGVALSLSSGLYLIGHSERMFYVAELALATGYCTLSVAAQVGMYGLLERAGRAHEFATHWSRALLCEAIVWAGSNAVGSPIATAYGLRTPYMIGMCCFAAIVIVAILIRDAAAVRLARGVSFRGTFRAAGSPTVLSMVAVFGCLCMWYRISYSLVPPMLKELKVDPVWFGTVTGLLYAAVGLAGLTAPWVARHLSLRTTSAVLLALNGAAFGVLGFATGAVVGLAFLLHTGARGLGRIRFHTAVNGAASAEQRAAAISLVKLSDRCFASLGLFLSGLAIDAVGIRDSMFLFGVAATVSCVIATLLEQPQRPERVRPVLLPSGSAAAGEQVVR